jgi:uncharacterized protein YndB with AHSA1/START domain
MAVLSDEVIVDAPPDAVYEFFRTMDEERYLAWHREHLAFRFVAGDRIAEGARAYFEEEIGDEHFESTVRYTEVRAPEYIEFRDEDRLTRLFNPKNTFAFESVDGGTRVVAEVHLRIGPLERLSSHVHHELEELRRHMREEGENLKRLVESGQIERAVAHP